MKSDDIDIEKVALTMASLESPMIKAYDGTYEMMPKADTEKYLVEIAAAIKSAKQPEECHQSISDFCTLYQCAFRNKNVNHDVISAMTSELPAGAKLEIGEMKNLNRAIEKMITRTLASDASCLKDILRVMIRVKAMRHFPRVINLFFENKKIRVVAMRIDR